MPKLYPDVFLCRNNNQDVSKVTLKFGGVFLEDPVPRVLHRVSADGGDNWGPDRGD